MGKKVAKNLNRGQMIGVGRENMVWPGLNAPILRGRELVQQQLLPMDEEREAKLIKLRDSMGKFRSLKLDPLERGWSGTKMPGRSIGPPDPIGEDTFEGFDTKVLELKVVTCMTAIFGRKRRMSMFSVTGNGNGLAGFALSKATTVPDVIRKVKNKAGQRLLYIHRYNDHTVLHDFFTQYACTKIYVKKMPQGYGLVCHRALRTICQVVGITDLHAKVEGSCNIQNMTKAFFLGLINQKTHQQLANEKQLHLVEFREENRGFPEVLASPEGGAVRTPAQIPKEEEIDFTRVDVGSVESLGSFKRRLDSVMDGDEVFNGRKGTVGAEEYAPFFTKTYGYEIYLKNHAKRRNQEKV
ncbi:28S ribosomal protein S5, mitochondrial [Chionoecetes opilio]|uniref:Small ribosomal subunit protein uS5m n=1 Tax=Chionoecetes opilio TaxID=41210 RepID=A0A8J5CRC1_CHIOP|nr:28S ribosomal protein S5, mitochondrial [Chionoecetes opilio]